jgi:hypothetical protein
MTIFEIINLLFFSKKNTYDEPDCECLSNFQPYLINRWLSFYGKPQATFVNDTLNKYAGVFQDKNDSYCFYYNLIPRQKFSRIQYIKKQKNTSTKANEDYPPQVASSANLSQREINLYIDLQNQLYK